MNPGDQSAAHINLKVNCQDGNEVFFRIKRSTRLKKLMNSYCRSQSVEINSVAFLFDGRLLRAEQTPDELEMNDGDEINVLESKLESAIKTLKSAKGDMDGRISNLDAQLKYGTNDMDRRMANFESQLCNMGRRVSHLEAQLCNLKTENDHRISDLEAQLRSLKTDNNLVVEFWTSMLWSIFSILKTTLSRTVQALNLDYLPTMSTSQSQLSTSKIESQMSGVTNEEEDKKNDDESTAHANIFLNIVSMNGKNLLFYMTRSDQLKVIMNDYADRQSVETNAIAFLYGGRRLRPEQTPNELEMEDGDVIRAMLPQTGCNQHVP